MDERQGCRKKEQVKFVPLTKQEAGENVACSQLGEVWGRREMQLGI